VNRIYSVLPGGPPWLPVVTGRPRPKVGSDLGARRPPQQLPSCEFTDEDGPDCAAPSRPGLLAANPHRLLLQEPWTVGNTDLYILGPLGIALDPVHTPLFVAVLLQVRTDVL